MPSLFGVGTKAINPRGSGGQSPPVQKTLPKDLHLLANSSTSKLNVPLNQYKDTIGGDECGHGIFYREDQVFFNSSFVCFASFVVHLKMRTGAPDTLAAIRTHSGPFVVFRTCIAGLSQRQSLTAQERLINAYNQFRSNHTWGNNHERRERRR